MKGQSLIPPPDSSLQQLSANMSKPNQTPHAPILLENLPITRGENKYEMQEQE